MNSPCRLLLLRVAREAPTQLLPFASAPQLVSPSSVQRHSLPRRFSSLPSTAQGPLSHATASTVHCSPYLSFSRCPPPPAPKPYILPCRAAADPTSPCRTATGLTLSCHHQPDLAAPWARCQGGRLPTTAPHGYHHALEIFVFEL